MCQVKNCRSELLLHPNDCHAYKMSGYPMYAGFRTSNQEGGLIFPLSAVLRVVKETEVIFSYRVREQGKRIPGE